jgi:periplasmic protein TonB
MLSLIPAQTHSVAPSWAAGVAVLFLSIGGLGGFAPLEPGLPQSASVAPLSEEIMWEEFDPPPALAPASSEERPPEPEDQPEQVLEIPEAVAIDPPPTPPEMVEIAELHPLVEPPKLLPITPPTPVETKPAPRPAPAPSKSKASPSAARRDSAGIAATGAAASISGNGTSSRKVIRSAKPIYPAALQRARVEGSVRLLVTVETDGYASSVVVSSSSGNSDLDESARDAVQRRWKWSPGQTMKITVPIKFSLR